MSVLLAPGPFGAGGQFFDTNGKPLNAGIINTYAAGTTTPLATYTTNLGNVANAVSIQLGVDGRPPQEIWLTGGSAYRFDLLDSLSNLIKTYDNLAGINDITGIGEWIATNLTTVFISSTSFSLPGNQTVLLPNGMRLKTANTGGTMYGKVVSSSYASVPNVTTFVIANDAGSVLDSGLSSVSYSILGPVNPSVDSDYVLRKATLVTSSGVTNIWATAGDFLHITGGTVTSVTSLGTALYAGNERTVIADGPFTLTNGAAIQCIGSANIAALAGDRFRVRAETTTIANVVQYSRATGKATVSALTPLVTVLTSGTGTYTPSSPKYMKVELIGGGAGGGGTAADGNPSGTAGGNTTFGGMTGSGGAGGLGTGSGASSGGTASGGDVNIPGGQGSSGANAGASADGFGGAGGSGYFGGAGGGAGTNQAGSSGATNSGGGGSGHGANAGGGGGCGGGSGGYCRKTITTVSASFSYAVGAGGSGATTAGSGGSGIIIVEEIYE